MARLVLQVLAIYALTCQSIAQLFPAIKNNPVAAIQDLSEQIQWQRTVVDQLPYLSSHRADQFVNLIRKEMFTAIRNLQENETTCAESLITFVTDLFEKKEYSLRMIDAWGKVGSGIATGNTKWYGRYYECLKVQNKGNFSGRYFILLFGSASQTAVSLGICFPDTCSEHQVTNLTEEIGHVLKIHSISAALPIQPTEWMAVDIAALVVFSCLGILVVTGTLYEVYLMPRSTGTYERLNEETEDVTRSTSVSSKIFLSFSLVKNTRAIFDTSQKEGNINVLHGMRFISMLWVILGHTFAFGPNSVDNVFDAAEYYITTWEFLAIGSAPFSVDTFFFLSGLLATYLGMREMKKRSGRLSIVSPYLYRYLRLTPAYGLCILFAVSLFGKIGDGPVWPFTFAPLKQACHDYWWTNLLYINNLHPTDFNDQCIGWSWYLANDMQFFWLSPFILWALFKSPLKGCLILFFGTVGSMVATGVISTHYKEQPQALQTGLLFHSFLDPNLPPNNSLAYSEYILDANVTTPQPPPSPSASDEFWSDTYGKPWCRVGVYFIGMMTGYLLYTTRLQIRMNKALALLGWIVASAVALALVYGLWGHVEDGTPLDVGVASFFNAVARPVWAACLAWVVVACSSGYGGPINTFLSWKAFIPLSRLTYCAYLFHPLVIYWAYNRLECTIHFSIEEISLRFVATATVAYAIAYVVSILIEMPMIGIIKTLIGRAPQPKTSHGEPEHEEQPQENAK